MRPVPLLLFAASLLAALATDAGTDARADAVLLDRVVARVDDRAILRSDLLARTKPFVVRGATLRAVEHEVLERMIEEILIEREAAERHVRVTDDEINSALLQIAAQNKLTRAELEAEVAKQGMTKQQYRAEVRRQILELKWLQLAVASAERPSNPDELGRFYDSHRKTLVAKLRAAAYIDVRE